jgi:Mn2+/Fe2+ NRAMP family transporter
MTERLNTAQCLLSDTGGMPNRSRGLREAVVRALAKVSLVLALAVLGALFMAMSAQGLHPHGGYAPSGAEAADQAASFAVSSGDEPRTAGLALALIVLVSGITVLAIGAARGERRPGPGSTPAPHQPRTCRWHLASPTDLDDRVVWTHRGVTATPTRQLSASVTS